METKEKEQKNIKKSSVFGIILLAVIIVCFVGIYLYQNQGVTITPPAKEQSQSTDHTENIDHSAEEETVTNSGDTEPPIIALRSSLELTLKLGETYTEPGFSAVDYIDGPLTDQVVVEGTVDTGKVGTYSITYQVSDLSGNICEVSRTIHVIDVTPPALEFVGGSDIYIPVEQVFVDPGVVCIDDGDGDISSLVAATGSVNTKETGAYQITYTVQDTSGNASSLTRNVYVFKKQPAITEIPSEKVVYLTFDDGPSKHTLTLLDTLEQFGAQATFFVTNQYPFNNDTIGLTHRKGHTIALHTYSHMYDVIYKSEENYFADLDKMTEICVKQTGQKPTILRFPGGTSNTVSKKYKKGIMSKLVESVEKAGYYYCDWNVDSGDAAGAKTAKEVADNVVAGIQKHPVSIVLQHDTSAYSVEAVKYILFWGIENGYTFLPMTEETEMIHFPTKN